ncbi:phospholipid scramblase 3-like [Artemia franciscana]|uniref:Phospholipid scramblase n=1 Tax=Artemia franciscana TaxID=6661 RepID=A0AA88LIP8_ARTSF|nr:hypothetical protein QYM36_001610 [Artemia franciscana]KAK2725217.1 hypothetical protein QYM36_001610 [Artemia franciscana]
MELNKSFPPPYQENQSYDYQRMGFMSQNGLPNPQITVGYQPMPMPHPYMATTYTPTMYSGSAADPSVGPIAYAPTYAAPPTGYYPPVQPVINQPVHTPGQHNGQNPSGASTMNLSFLSSISELKIAQKKELLEVMLSYESQNKYEIFGSNGELLFNSKEESGCCSRQLFGSSRPFEMAISAPSGQEIIHLSRPLACGSLCFPCCQQEMEVFSPPGNLIASIQKEWTLLTPLFSVYDSTGQKIFKVKGSMLTTSFFGNDVDFKVIAGSDTEVGCISKKWGGLLTELVTDADKFNVTFPVDLDVRMKAALLGLAFLIDFLYFEKN